MCFVLYMGTRTEPPDIPWDEGRRRVHTRALSERDAPVRDRFALPCVTYVGSDLHCGCGFRHVSYQGDGWPEEEILDRPEYGPESTQHNHDELVELIRDHHGSEGHVELYGCWDGDFSGSPECVRDISLEEIVRPRFHFRERGLYTVRVSD